MAGGRENARYRKRRPFPALLMLLALGLVATFVWLQVLETDVDTASSSCNPPSAPPAPVEGQPPTTLGQPLAKDALDRTAPTPAAQVLVRVVNASSQRGQAAEITEALRQLGFAQVAPPGNDPLYPTSDLSCRAQIRFGEQGTPAARTLSMVEPCAELVRDERQDATVDLALGQLFDDLRPRTEGRRVLEQLTRWAAEHPEAQGGLQADPSLVPDIDPGLLAAARQATC